MKLANTAPITGATVYRIRCPSPFTMFGPKDLAGFILAPVKPPHKNDKTPTIEPTPKARKKRLTYFRQIGLKFAKKKMKY